MERLLPRDLWRSIYAYDPTFRNAFSAVVRQLEGRACKRCVAAGRGGNRRRAAFDGFTDVRVTRSGSHRWVGLSCRACGTVATVQVECADGLVSLEAPTSLGV